MSETLLSRIPQPNEIADLARRSGLRSSHRDAIVLHAEQLPLSGVAHPGPQQLYRHPKVVLESRDLGDIAPDHLRIEMLYAGVCGTDVHLVTANPNTGYIQTSSPVSLPPRGRILGHEGIGRIIEIGHEVRRFQVGACVAFESIISCGSCDCCRRGLLNQCRNARLLGLEVDGLYATIADIPASVACDVSAFVQDDRDLRSLANLEPASVAFLACQKAGITARDRVVVFGAGPIGTYCAMLARIAFSARSVHVVEPVPFRRQFAARYADSVHTPQQFLAGFDEPVDVVIEASGDLPNIEGIMRMVDAGGRIVLLGRSGQPLSVTATDHIITNAISIVGSRGPLGGAFDTILKLYQEHLFDPGDVVTSILDGLENLQQLLSNPDRLLQQDCKVLVNFKSK
jgi:threonine dehydrogenase-like Zn-dependent dehydrogenase